MNPGEMTTLNKDNPYICNMSRMEKLFDNILGGRSDNNIKFNELCSLLEKMGFQFRIKGSHHIYFKEGIEEIINLQSVDGHSKPYQVKQVRDLIIKYKIAIQRDEEV